MHIKKKMTLLSIYSLKNLTPIYTLTIKEWENLFQSTLTNIDVLNYIFSSYLIMFLFSLVMK